MAVKLDIDGTIRTLAERQHGVVARKALLAEGVSSGAISRRIDNGSLITMSPRVLRVSGAPLTDLALCMAAVLDSGADAAQSHLSAAARWGLPGFSLRPMEVTGDRSRTTHGQSELARIHQPRNLFASHIVFLDGVPITTPSRTIVDLAGDRRIHRARVARTLDTAWTRGLVCHASMTATMQDVCGRGRAGSALLRELMEERGPDYIPPGSGAEARFQEIARSVGMWAFERQAEVGDSAWIGRVDFIDRTRRLVVEIDSALFHGSITDRRRDEVRYERLRAAGFTVLAIDSDDLFHRRSHVEQLLRALLREAA